MNIDEQLKAYNRKVQDALFNRSFNAREREIEEAMRDQWDKDDEKRRELYHMCQTEAPEYVVDAAIAAYEEGDTATLGHLVSSMLDKHTRAEAEREVDRG